MLTVVITRPPFTYAFTTSSQYIFNSRKTTLSVLHVESHRFLSLVSSWVIVSVAIVGATVAGAKGVGVLLLPEGACVGTGGSLRELVCYIPANQQSGDLWTSFKGSPSLSLPVSLFRSWSCRVKKKKKTKNVVGQGCNAMSAIAASCSAAGPAPRVAALPAQRRKLQRCWPLPQQWAATRCRPRRSVVLLGATVQRRHLPSQ